MDSPPEGVLHRLHGRDAEMFVLLQRADLLNNVPALAACDHGKHVPVPRRRDGTASRDALKRKLVSMCGCEERVSNVQYGRAEAAKKY